jgi:hypothetical protein
VLDWPSQPPSIENMNYQWRAGRRRKKSPARIEVKTTPKHDKKEQEKANHQRALFDVREHSDPPETVGTL